eukprot:TRINITY_DN34589_c0_g1_i3.p1 TRINITY_DN34589_c0_g1~~TRINITY_DN34589_c0_g1_i3.p1  ORF type:complete len:600 (+),score=108.71 TRINITY_DN34589_c0_g1_i3:217-2016(+)
MAAAQAKGGPQPSSPGRPRKQSLISSQAPSQSSASAGTSTASLAVVAGAALASALHTDETPSVRPIDPASFSMGDQIGKGRFKRVHRGLYGRREVVILRYMREAEAQEQEILTLLSRGGSGSFVPEIFGVCHGPRQTFIVQELAKFGSLKGALLDEETRLRVSETHKLFCAAQVSRAMAFLETLRIVHADLSCRNLLLFRLELDPSLIVIKVTDFGLAFQLERGSHTVKRKQPQATRWCSPETVLDTELSHRSDVWSLGTTLWECFAGGTSPWTMLDSRNEVATKLKALTHAAKTDEAVDDIAENFPMPEGCPPSAHETVLSCLIVDSWSRPSFSQLTKAFQQVIGELGRAKRGESGGCNNVTRQSTDSTLSTMDTPRSKVTEAEGGKGIAAAYKALKAAKHKVVQDLGEEAADALWQRIEVKHACTTAGRAQSPPPGSQKQQSPVGTVERLMSSDSTVLQGATQATQANHGSIRDVVVPLIVSPGQQLPPSHAAASLLSAGSSQGVWSVWSYVTQPSIRRQDFATSSEAWAAFDRAGDGSTPCVLRDPSGKETAARSWVVSPSRQRRQVVTTGSPMHGSWPSSSPPRTPGGCCRRAPP